MERSAHPGRIIKKLKHFFALAVLALAFQITHAQVRFSASLNTNSVPLNQNFQLNFTIENGEGSQLKLPNLNDFQVLSGPNTSQNMQWINGNVTQSVSYSFILRPKKEGTFKIGKAAVKISGATLESNEVTINVTGPAQQQAQQQRRGYNPFDPFGDDDPFGDNPFGQEQEEEPQQPQATKGDVEKQIKENVFTRLVVNKNNVFLGEQLTATLKLYYRLNFGNTQLSKAPTFNGFWSQEIAGNPNQKPTVENINGQQFYVLEVQKFNLFPQKTGTLQITPAELNMIVQAQVRTKSRNAWDAFFGGGGVQNFQYKTTSNAININVKELPESGKPADFNGAVGKFNYSATLSSKEGKTDDALTFSMKIFGNGNLKMVEAVKPNMPEGFEVFDPKTKDDVQNDAGGMSGSKQYDYLIIPRMPGDYKIPKTSFSYFDPSAAKYFTISSPEYALKITGEPSKNNVTDSNLVSTKEEVSLLGSDIRYIKTKHKEFETTPSSFFGSWSYISLFATPFLLFSALIFARKKNEESAADIIGTKRRRALKLVKKRLTIAEKLLTKNDKEGFYNEMSRAIWGYLGDKLNIDPAKLSKENVEDKLVSRGVKTETISSLISLISTCELALYAPLGAANEMKQNYSGAMELMADLEGEIKN